MYSLLFLFACSVVERQSSTAEASQVQRAPLEFSSLGLRSIDGSSFDHGELQGKVVLFVNVASKCGFTSQYEGLQQLQDQYASKGLVVVGVPCNQFGGQEPGKPEEIVTFCKKNYGVTFPLLEKQDVNGENRSELYSALIGSGRNIRWNFEKILVTRDGSVAERYGSSTSPLSEELVKAIEGQL